MSIDIRTQQQENTNSNKRGTTRGGQQERSNKDNIKSFLKEHNYKNVKEMCSHLKLNYNTLMTDIKRDKRDSGNRLDKKLIEISLQINNISNWEQLQKIINASKINIAYTPIRTGD